MAPPEHIIYANNRSGLCQTLSPPRSLTRIGRHCQIVIPAKAGIQKWRGVSRRDRLQTWDGLRVQGLRSGSRAIAFSQQGVAEHSQTVRSDLVEASILYLEIVLEPRDRDNVTLFLRDTDTDVTHTL